MRNVSGNIKIQEAPWTATRTLIKVRDTDKINGHSYMQKNYSKQVQF